MSPVSWVFSLKHAVYLLLAVTGLTLLATRRTARPWRLATLAASFVLLGGVIGLVVPPLADPLGMHPSPMCCLNKLLAFWWIKGRVAWGLGIGLGVMLGLSLVARKLFCGWVCPLGAGQELLHLVPTGRKLSPPFFLANGARTALFAAFLVLLAALGVITYDSFNGFEALHWRWDAGIAVTALAIALASLFVWRPYCHWVCPLGWVTWLLEPVALLKVRVDRAVCDGCQACLAQAPCSALPEMVEGKARWTGDCNSCGQCLDACPKGALRFGR